MNETPGKHETPGKYAQDPAAPAGLRRGISLAVCAAASLAFILAFLYDSRVSALTDVAGLTKVGLTNVGVTRVAQDATFNHSGQAHSRLPCLLCHRRESNAAQPVRSGHTPCSGCHAQEFATATGPLCAICHTGVGSSKPGVKPFPSLKSFNMEFDHAGHRGVTCSRCHKPASRGVALSIPSGFNAHTTCYQCHSPRAESSGRDISSCGTCHKPGEHVRTPISARAFRVNFSHARHGSAQSLSCNDCHTVRGGAGGVTSPAPLQHSASARTASCMKCHNNERAFGGDDFSDCKRCHTRATFRF